MKAITSFKKKKKKERKPKIHCIHSFYLNNFYPWNAQEITTEKSPSLAPDEEAFFRTSKS